MISILLVALAVCLAAANANNEQNNNNNKNANILANSPLKLHKEHKLVQLLSKPHEALLKGMTNWVSTAARHSTRDSSILSARSQSHSDRILSSSEPSSRMSAVIQYSDNCETHCMAQLREAFTAIDPTFSFVPLPDRSERFFSKAGAFKDVLDRYPDSVSAMIPYIDDYKIQLSLFETNYESASTPVSTYKDPTECGTFMIQVTALNADELSAFKSKMIELGNTPSRRFATNFERASAGSDFYITVQASPSKVVNGVGESVYTCHSSVALEIIHTLASIPEIVYIEEKPVISLANKWSKGLCQTGQEGNTPLYESGYQLNGTGHIIAVSDTGIDMKNCYFYDPDVNVPYRTVAADPFDLTHRKVVSYVPNADYYDDDIEAHGTHVAGSVAGYSVLDYGDFKKFNGVAYGAKLAFFDIGTSSGGISVPAAFADSYLTPFYNQGVRIFTNSWVSVGKNTYDGYAPAIDAWMRTHPDALVLFSNGNSGDKGNYTVWAPATFKNGLSVGAASNDHKSWSGYTMGQAVDDFKSDSMMTFSSQGPTADGRLKPDIVVPGSFITSAHGKFNVSDMHCDIVYMQGTSMAAPTAAGVVTLIREYFIRGFYPSGRETASDSMNPSGALLKAMMIAAGNKMSRVVKSKGDGTASYDAALPDYPDVIQGYGRVILSDVLQFEKASQATPLSLFVKGSISGSNYVALSVTGDSHTYSVTTDASTPKLRAVLTYSDTAATSGALSGVVLNKLKISIPGHPALSASSVDENVYMIEILNPGANTFTITVSAQLIQVGPQPYALVVTGSVNPANTTSSDGSSQNAFEEVLNRLTSTKLSAGMQKIVIGLSILAGVLTAIVVSLKCTVRKLRKEHEEREKKALELQGKPEDFEALAVAQMQQIEMQRLEYEEQQRKQYLAIQNSNRK